MILYSCGINHSKLKVTTGRLVQCWLESPLCSLMVAGPRLISHLLAPISQSVTLPATWNLQLHLGLLKKARQPKWRRCSQWRLTCPVACCKLKGEVEDGIARRGVDDMAFVATMLSTTSSAIDVLHTCLQMCDISCQICSSPELGAAGENKHAAAQSGQVSSLWTFSGQCCVAK